MNTGEAPVRRSIEDAEALYRPFRRGLRGNQKGRVGRRVVPLRYWTPPVFSEKSRRIESCRLRTGLGAQPVPPQRQYAGVAPLPRGRKWRRILPVGHIPTLSLSGLPGIELLPQFRVDVQSRFQGPGLTL